MEKRSRRKFTKEFKAETVALIRRSGKSIAEVCREMGLPESSVHRWLAQADIDTGQRDGLTTAEREELSHLRRELRVVREERDVLAKVSMPGWAAPRMEIARGWHTRSWQRAQ